MNPGDDTTDAENAADENGEETPAGPAGKLAGKLKWMLAALGLVIVLGGGAGLWYSGVFTPDTPQETTVELPGPTVFHELPRITVDLKPSANRARPFIRVLMQAELEGENAKQAVINNEARIMDTMQAHLRETTAEELQGEMGTEQLREDFTTIINRIIQPERAVTVLYKEILIR